MPSEGFGADVSQGQGGEIVRLNVETVTRIEITINDPDVIERITGPKGDDWRASLYPLHTRQDVLDHLAYNAAVNGVGQANRLDGWADLPDDAAVMRVVDYPEVLEVSVAR